MLWFKNASVLALPLAYSVPFALEERLAEHPLRDPGPLEMETRGFVEPVSIGTMTRFQDSAYLLALGIAERLLPVSVLNDAVNERIVAHMRHGRKPGKRRREELKQAALEELLPRAFIRRSRTLAFLDLRSRMLVIDSASDKAGEDIASAIREALGAFPARPLAAEASLTLLMSEWLRSGELPEGFELGTECELKDPSDTHAVARFKCHDLSAEEIRQHLARGMQVSQLGLIYEQRVGFVLDSSLRLRRIEFLDIVAEKLDELDGADLETLIDAEFTLMLGELRKLFDRLDSIVTFVR
jgi:recombination associated protein RdgC